MYTLGLFSYGGVIEQTVDSVIKELSFAGANKIQLGYQRISGDALIPRSRSRTLGSFYERAKSGDAIVFVDHDTEWRPGDLCHIAEKAVQKKALVGGLYCKRAFKRGWSSRVPSSGTVEFGKPGLLETGYLATGFLAIPWDVIKTLEDKLAFNGEQFQKDLCDKLGEGNPEDIRKLCDLSIDKIRDGAWKTVEHEYWDFFRCIRIPSGKDHGEGWNQFISEDWAFSLRCNYCGIKSYLSTYPILTHYGEHGYTIPDGMDDDALKEHAANLKEVDGQHKNKKTVSNKGKNKGVRGASK